MAIESSSAAAATHPQTSPDAATIIPLRRAVYVDVDKLVRSQYSIDLQRLQDELKKLKTTTETGSEPSFVSTNEAPDENVASNEQLGGGDSGFPVISEEGGAGSVAAATAEVAAAAAKPVAWPDTSLSVRPGGTLRSTLPYVKHHHQSRLQPPRNGFNLCLRVGKVDLVVDKYRVDGARVLVAEVEVGDVTGAVSLRARDAQIELLRRVSRDGDAIVLRNCTIEVYRGMYLRLAVNKWGKISVYPDGIASTPPPPSSINHELNFSLVDLNIITEAKMPTEQTFPIPVATVHQKHQKHHQRHSPKHLEDSTSRGGTARNTQSRLHSGGGGGGTGVQYAYQKKRNDGWQQQHQQHIHQQHPGRPRSGSHNTSGSGNSQYSGGSFSPPGMNFFPQMHYQQQYSDVSSVYSCSTPQPPPGGGVGDPDQRGGPPPQNVPHRQLQPQFLPNDHYGRQHHLLYQQYALQARHTQQMQALQQQQESQRRRLEQQQHHQAHSLIPELSHGPSFESGGGAIGPGGTFPPLSPNMQPLPSPLLPPPLPPSTSSEYQYAALSSAMGNMFPGERGGPSLQQNPHELEEEQS